MAERRSETWRIAGPADRQAVGRQLTDEPTGAEGDFDVIARLGGSEQGVGRGGAERGEPCGCRFTDCVVGITELGDERGHVVSRGHVGRADGGTRGHSEHGRHQQAADVC